MKFDQLAKYTVIFTAIPAFFYFMFPGQINGITILCSYPLFFLLLLFVFKREKVGIDGIWSIKLFIVYNVVIFLRGIYDAKSIQDWIVLISGSYAIFLFFPLTIYFGANKKSLKMAIKSFLTYIAITSIVLILNDNGYKGSFDFAHTISPIYLLIIFVPYVQLKNRIFIYVLSSFSFFSDLSVRANLLNIIVALLISATYYLRKSGLTKRYMKYIRTFFLYGPILFLVLGVTGSFNIFKINEIIGDYTEDYRDGRGRNLAVDSRTGIYLDVILELNKRDAFIWGLGGSGKTETHLTETTWGDFDELYKEGRRATESGMLNYAQWGGIIGVLIYWQLFAFASYYGMYKSKNWLIVMIGLWIAYKAMFSFVEDRLIFSIATLFIFIPIGMCFNKELREMSNDEIKIFLRSIFIK